MQNFGHPHSFQLTGAHMGESGPLQHIWAPLNPHQPDPRYLAGAGLYQVQSPLNPHVPDPRYMAGAQLPYAGQQARGEHQHIQSPLNPHVPDPRHLAGAQLPYAGQQARGEHQHIVSPLNPHQPQLAGAQLPYAGQGARGEHQQIVGSQLPYAGQQARGEHQHIQSPLNPHVPDPRHLAGAALEYPRGEWRYQIMGCGSSVTGADAVASTASSAQSLQTQLLTTPALMIGIGLALGLVGGVLLAPEVNKLLK